VGRGGRLDIARDHSAESAALRPMTHRVAIFAVRLPSFQWTKETS
jgi:hypothetical protein